MHVALRALVLASLLAVPAVAQAPPPEPLFLDGFAAGPPDADLVLPLSASFRDASLPGEPLAWVLEASFQPPDGTAAVAWTEASGAALASPESAAWNATFQARHGPGAYTLLLRASGERLAPAEAFLQLAVPDVRNDSAALDFALPASDPGNASAPPPSPPGIGFTLPVPDAPTTLRFTNDTVNADGKAKAPGTDLVTRFVLADPNGLADVARVTITYARLDPGGPVAVDRHVLLGWNGTATSVSLEDRFHDAPLRDGSYVETVLAESPSGAVLTRNFTITDAAPQASLDAPGNASFAGDERVLRGTLTVRDANFGTGPLDSSDVGGLPLLHLQVYRGSARVAEESWRLEVAGAAGNASLDLDLRGFGVRSAPWPVRAVNGTGEIALPFVVHVADSAPPGTYRLSVSAASTLATASWDVPTWPQVTSFEASLDGSTVRFAVAARDLGPASLLVRAPWGPVAQALPADLAPQADGAVHWSGAFPLPPAAAAGAVALQAVADLGGGRLLGPAGAPWNARNVSLLLGPARLAAELRVAGAPAGAEAWLHPRAAGALTVEGLADPGNVTCEVRDWNGAPVAWNVTLERDAAGTRLRVAPARAAERGRYTLVLRDGSGANATLTVHLASRFRLAVLAPPEGVTFAPGPLGAQANFSVAAAGNAPATTLALVFQGLPAGTTGNATLTLPDGTALDAPVLQGQARFAGDRLLGPGETAGVRVVLRPGLPAAGIVRGRLLVAGETS